MTTRTPAIVLGGTGYVAGELVRLLLGHPQLELAAVASDSQPGEPVAEASPHLAAALGGMAFASQEEAAKLAASLPRSAVLAAAPHGVSATLIDSLLARAEAAGGRPTVVDISADYRFATPRPMPGSTSTPTAPRHGRHSSPARCPSTSRPRPRPTSRTPAVSARRRSSPPCRCWHSA